MIDDFFGLELPLVTDDDDAMPSGWRYLSGGGLVRCAFSTRKPVKMGQGANRRTHSSRNYWFVEQLGRDRFESRTLNDRNTPAGDARYLSLRELISGYTPEPAYYEEHVLPAMIERESAPGKGGGRRSFDDDERARPIEEKNVRALFGMALVFLERGEADRAGELLSELAGIKAEFEGKDQHLFNEFGIALRKNHQFPEAVAFFRRALDFVEDDDHLYYNLARAHYENDDWAASLDSLVLSHRLNPGLAVARDLFEVMVGLENNPTLRRRYGKPEVPPNVASRAREVLASGTGKLRLDDRPVKVGIDIEPGRVRSGPAVGVVELKKHGSDE
ncbi:MAG: tetratricopeptide repeat protein [Desulfovibrionaceae bacterium]|nr:tetratricopeptide repeat protein [Desulfovibrionaceae bacterium]